MDFVKMEGLGNDFVVVDGPVELFPETVRRWCRRRYGIGADGVLAVTPVDPERVRMQYWNADGSPAEMCGNGLRCVALLARRRGWVASDRFIVETPVGPRPVEILGPDLVRALVGAPKTGRVETLQVAGHTVHPVDVGNPHAVLLVEDPETAPVEEWGRRIGSDPIFPDGANVEFMTVDGDTVKLRVWERGVGETLACGTGAAAAAYVAARDSERPTRVTVELPGGTLDVELDDQGAWLEGPAHVVFEGRTLDATEPVS